MDFLVGMATLPPPCAWEYVDVLRQHVPCMQDSKFFQMFDVDGDGLISYSEYLLLITFLSIPVEVGAHSLQMSCQRRARNKLVESATASLLCLPMLVTCIQAATHL